MLEKALVGSRGYWRWLMVLGAVIVLGVIAYLRQFAFGLGVTGLSRDVTWGLYIAQFTFLVGVAASAVMVVLPYYLHDFKTFGKLTILGEFLAISAVTMCMLFIFVDMGQPTRVLNVMLYPTPHSLMFWDMVSLMGYLVLNTLISHVTLGAERNGIAPPRWIKPIIILSIPWAVSIHTVTAFLYSGLAARPFWMTAILGAALPGVGVLRRPRPPHPVLPRPEAAHPLRRRARADPAARHHRDLRDVDQRLLRPHGAVHGAVQQHPGGRRALQVPLRRPCGQRDPRAVDVDIRRPLGGGSRPARQPEDAPQRDHARRGVRRRLRRPLDREGAGPHHRRFRALAARQGHGVRPHPAGDLDLARDLCVRPRPDHASSSRSPCRSGARSRRSAPERRTGVRGVVAAAAPKGSRNGERLAAGRDRWGLGGRAALRLPSGPAPSRLDGHRRRAARGLLVRRLRSSLRALRRRGRRRRAAPHQRRRAPRRRVFHIREGSRHPGGPPRDPGRCRRPLADARGAPRASARRSDGTIWCSPPAPSRGAFPPNRGTPVSARSTFSTTSNPCTPGSAAARSPAS